MIQPDPGIPDPWGKNADADPMAMACDPWSRNCDPRSHPSDPTAELTPLMPALNPLCQVSLKHPPHTESFETLSTLLEDKKGQAKAE